MGSAIKSLYEAKTELSSLVDRAASGEEFVIAKNGRPLAKLIPFVREEVRRPGLFRGKIRIADDFDDPLPDDFLIVPTPMKNGRRKKVRE